MPPLSLLATTIWREKKNNPLLKKVCGPALEFDSSNYMFGKNDAIFETS
jgi:hypothetical protein